MKNLKLAALTVLGIMSFISCEKDEKPVVEEEVITTVNINFSNENSVVSLSSKDVDGDGPKEPLVTVEGNFLANTEYRGSIDFLNESKTPAEDVTEEIEELAAEHQIFYQVPATLGTFVYKDKDKNNGPVGLEFTYTTKEPTTGNLVVTLRHKPNKAASGVVNGNIANAGGSTDIAVSFPVKVVAIKN